ncbi:MAG TPA: alpha/beta hydrolase [Candidatus Eisenbacteria bacterium]|nr:alpha/beta hydrolase [Candidatus Eisenbacteria bacterium]
MAIRQIIGGLLADRYPPEKHKFKSALLLIHGVWAGSWVWESWATHFANLGWDCSAINLRGRTGDLPLSELKRVDFERCVEDIAAVLKSFSAPPVVLAMDLGCLLAFKASEQAKSSALILIAPASPRNLSEQGSRARRLLRLKYSPLMFLRRPIRIDAKDFREYFLYPLAVDLWPQAYARTVPESPFLVREFLLPRAILHPGSPSCPSLVIAGAADTIQPPAGARKLAEHLGSDYKEYAGQGHWLIERDSEAIVRDIHRWTIQQLGERILLAEAP